MRTIAGVTTRSQRNCPSLNGGPEAAVAALRRFSTALSYDAATRTISAGYDADGPADGYQFTLLTSTDIDAAGSDWQMAPSDFFAVRILGQTSLPISLGQLTIDNFTAAPTALSFVPEPHPSAVTITFAPGDYDNTQNLVNAGPAPVNNQTTGKFRDIFWWGTADGLGNAGFNGGDADFINSGKNLISNEGTPARAVVGGDDNALNFTGVKIPNGGKSFLTIYDTTPADGATTRNLFDASQPGGLTVSADVLFAPGQHAASGGVVALFSEDQDALALLADNGGGSNADVPKLSLIFQSNGNGIVLDSVSLNPDGGSGGLPFLGDTGPDDVGATSGDHWYRVNLNVEVSGDSWSATGSFFNHLDPTDPNSALVGTDIAGGALSFSGSLSVPSASTVDLARVLTNPGQVGLMAKVTGPFGDGINTNAGGTPANPLVDNVGVSITNFSVIPEPTALSLLALGGLAILLRRRMK